MIGIFFSFCRLPHKPYSIKEISPLFCSISMSTGFLQFVYLGVEERSITFKGSTENPDVFPYSECFYPCSLGAIFNGAEISHVDTFREVIIFYGSLLIARKMVKRHHIKGAPRI